MSGYNDVPPPYEGPSKPQAQVVYGQPQPQAHVVYGQPQQQQQYYGAPQPQQQQQQYYGAPQPQQQQQYYNQAAVAGPKGPSGPGPASSFCPPSTSPETEPFELSKMS